MGRQVTRSDLSLNQSLWLLLRIDLERDKEEAGGSEKERVLSGERSWGWPRAQAPQWFPAPFGTKQTSFTWPKGLCSVIPPCVTNHICPLSLFPSLSKQSFNAGSLHSLFPLPQIFFLSLFTSTQLIILLFKF